jgi:hypothetical protein
VNVRPLLIATILLPLISGCSILGWKSVEPIEIKTKAVERTRLNLSDPAPIQARELQWVIITKDNAQEVFKRLEEKGVDIVLFGLTDEGYEQLALTMAELRNYIAQQKTIIIKYKDYYEPKEK